MRIVLFFIFFTLPFNFLQAQSDDLLFEDLSQEFEELGIDDYSDDRGIDSVEDDDEFTEDEEVSDNEEVTEDEDATEDEDTESRSIDSTEDDETGYERYLDESEDAEDYDVVDEGVVYEEEEIEGEVRDLASDEELAMDPSEEIYEERSIDSDDETFEVELNDDGSEYDPEAYDVEEGYEDDPYNEEDIAYDDYDGATFADESVSEENIIDDIVSESILEEDDPRAEESSRNIASEAGYLEEEFADIEVGETDDETSVQYGYEDEEYDDGDDGEYEDDGHREIASDGLNAPDLDLEAYLDDIFSQYSDRLEQAKWEEMIGDEKVKEVYDIQPGDTMWDISTTLFGSGYFWPKIWQVNSVILNPHFILSGGQIRFTPGSAEGGPKLDLVTGEEAEDILTSSSNIPDLPPAQETRYSNLPDSLRGMNLGAKEQTYREPSSFNINDFLSAVENSPIYINAYLTTKKPPSFGKIVSAEEWDTVASTHQHVYIKGRDLSIGNNYIVFDDDERVSHPTRASNAGFLVSILGVLNIVELVDEREDLYRAKVIKAMAPITVGSNIGEDNSSLKYNLAKTEQVANFKATVVSGYAGNNRVFVGMNEIMFLDMGSEHGVKTGDMIQIIAKKSNKRPTSKKIVATAKVVKTNLKRATAVVLTTSDVIEPGYIAEAL